MVTAESQMDDAGQRGAYIPSRDGPVISPQYRMLSDRGLSAGDFHGAIMAQVRRAMDEVGRRPLDLVRLGLNRLELMGLISASEGRGLLHVVGLVFAAEHGHRNWQEVFGEVREYHQSLIVDGKSSSTALAISSIAADSTLTGFLQDRGGVGSGMAAAAAGTTGGGAVGADVGGAVGGAYGGAVLGGPGGAALGATFGAIGASMGAVVGGIIDKQDDPT